MVYKWKRQLLDNAAQSFETDHSDGGASDREDVFLKKIGEHAPCPARPGREPLHTLPQLLPAGAAFDLEVALPGRPTVVGEAQKSELLRFRAALVRILTSKAPELKPLRLLRRQLQPEALHPGLKLQAKPLRIALELAVAKAYSNRWSG